MGQEYGAAQPIIDLATKANDYLHLGPLKRAVASAKEKMAAPQKKPVASSWYYYSHPQKTPPSATKTTPKKQAPRKISGSKY